MARRPKSSLLSAEGRSASGTYGTGVVYCLRLHGRPCHTSDRLVADADLLSTVDGKDEGFRLGGLGTLERPKTGGSAGTVERIGSRGRSEGRPGGRASNVVPAPPRKTLPAPALPRIPLPEESELEESLDDDKTRERLSTTFLGAVFLVGQSKHCLFGSYSRTTADSACLPSIFGGDFCIMLGLTVRAVLQRCCVRRTLRHHQSRKWRQNLAGTSSASAPLHTSSDAPRSYYLFMCKQRAL